MSTAESMPNPALVDAIPADNGEALDLLRRLEAVGFYGVEIDKWEGEPFAVVEGIEFRSVTITARKGKEGPCLEAGQAVLYKGPWKAVVVDDGHTLERGVRTAVCAKTFRILSGEPYADEMIGIEPMNPIPENAREEFDCSRTEPRNPRETRSSDYRINERVEGSCC